MNETIDLLRRRRSAPVPLLMGPAPDEEQIQTLLTIASRVPDHGKIAPWRFLVFAGEARARAGGVIADVFAAANPDADAARLNLERNRFSAPLVVGVVSRPVAHAKVPEWEQVLSSGAACMTLIVAANGMGFETVWLTEWYAYDRGVLQRFGLAPDERMAGFIHIGHASAPRDDRPRPTLTDIVTWFEG
jgi:nitroreductase